MKLLPQLALALLCALASTTLADINYTEVTPSNTTGLTGGSSPWTERTPYGSASSVWQSSSNTNELATTITGLNPGSNYAITLFTWDDNGINGSNDWNIEASFTSGTGFTYYAAGGPNAEEAYDVHQVNPIVGITYTSKFPFLRENLHPAGGTDETSNRDMWVLNIGNQVADGSGNITVYMRHPNLSGRTWIDGVGTEALFSPNAPTDITLSNSIINKTAPIGTLVGTLTTTDPTPGDTFTYSLVGGPGSTDNANFAIDGDRLESDRDLSSFSGPLNVRIRSADAAGEYTEKTFAITLNNDSDNDGLDDGWELTYFPNLAAQDASGDPDFDALTNQGEFFRGTDPTNPDTDNDSLLDSAETGTGFYSSFADTGTSPLNPDSDGDSLLDGAEIDGSTGHITDPNLFDTDNDGFSDSLEITENTDPNNPNDFPTGALSLRINEILPRNSTDLEDGFNNEEDWIEIFNPNTTPVNVIGYHLTDDSALLTKYTLPSTIIPAGGYLVVFASGKNTTDPAGNIHTNFSLSGNGEYLAIVRPNGTSIDDAHAPTYPEQFTDISYGRHPSNGTQQFFEATTPGAANSPNGYPGVVKDTNFSIDRGFYSSPFQLAISTATPGASIRYTTDGSEPTPSSGTVYNGTPIDITTTATIRAIAYQSGFLPTNIDTHTYIFVTDVATQPSNPPGWPLDWTSGVPSDYEMDPRVVNDDLGIAEHTMSAALLDLPTVAISMEIGDFIGDSSSPGIYSHPTQRFEKTCAVEYIHPDGTPGFQEDCKIEAHGNSSRNPNRMQKHSLRLTFSSTVGTSKLRYPLFPESEVEEFNKLVLRACFTDSWALTSWSSSRYRPNDSLYMRDVWMKESFGAMGQPTSYGNFVHLYVNGLYFGMHNLTERIEDDWYADHLGGEKEDWQVSSDFGGLPSRWNTMMGILNGNIGSNTVYENAKNYIDVENCADYMLLHFYADAEDWPHKNGYAAVNTASGDGRFVFSVWDQEIALDKFSWNRYNSSSGAGAPFQRLRQNAEFRILFADRVQKHLFNDGALSQTSSADRILEICGEIDKAIHAESARWGDVQATTPYGSTAGSSTNVDNDNYPPTINNPIYFTREQHWLTERDNVTGHYIPILHDQSDSRSIITELRANNLFPNIDAPTFSQHGGVVQSGYNLGFTAPAGTIYYTLDGTDPRDVGGTVSGTANTGTSTLLTQTGIVRARALNGGEWSALTEAEFIVGITAAPSNLVVSEIYYNPPGSDEDTEFIELMNIHPANTIDLTGVTITGITYAFPAATTLPPLGRILIVRDQTAFAAANNIAGLNIAPGDFGTTGLSNGGEEIAIIAQDGTTDIRRFTYDDKPAWPTSPDGEGYSLVLVAPESDPDHSNPTNWRSSTTTGGNPGTTDAAPPFSGNATADDDNDGLNEFMEHALGTSDTNPASTDPPIANHATFDDGTGTQREYLTITYQRNLTADDILYQVQISQSLDTWNPLPVAHVSATNNDDGTETVTYRSTIPIDQLPRQFIRLHIESR